MTITVIGIDCAVKEHKVGVAIVRHTDGICSLVSLPSRAKMDSVAELVCGWINRSARTLLALDAPLGWPTALGTTLSGHLAGDGIEASPDALFRRATDRFAKAHLNKQPLDIGADKIARTAKAALDLLTQVRSQTNLAVPLVWSAGFTEKDGAIEVYPAGTLVSYGLPNSGYKEKDQTAVRKQILKGLGGYMRLQVKLEDAEKNADVLDAIICRIMGTPFTFAVLH